ncbi:uncharacterized protein MELLADRAFT_86571 [Melampsora larici-populina 98AG31]|uniref:CMP/dCMP-type deaminase domain-containing protein n=1 Tax=Melampsora larici-populina (strain 98AG31 / pathotype 3-4-7) TaxID=747676 RepID=F4RM99_MELLP|nr:uncharacterized protein MELLADRAFT_86571 [Melampsora larici-populina 98AG31]EGG06385.1 hypothetical protein MELLADRAFT_86571 [Melampsora larici-populina 98AG31]
MSEAIKMAEEAFSANEIPVGCVFINELDGKLISKGRNRTNETRNASLHAEFDALSSLLPNPKNPNLKTDFKNLTLYVTVEPCLMCSSALRQIGIKKVFFGCSNDRFGGCGGVISIHNDPRLLFSEPFVAYGGYRREEAIILLRKFYITENSNAPVPKKKTNRVLKFEMPPL